MTTFHWNALSGDFDTAADWSPNQVPGMAANVFIDASGSSYTVTSSSAHQIKTLSTVTNATLAVTGGTFTITNGTGSGENAGIIRVSDGATLAIGGTFTNGGQIALNSTGDSTKLIINKDTVLEEGFDGKGTVTLSAGGHNFIMGSGSAATLSIYGNTIAGAGKIGGGDLTLNVSYGTIDGNSTKAALTLNTGSNKIINATTSVIEGTTAKGLVIVSDVENGGTLEALGTNARLRIDGKISDADGIVEASGNGAHVGLASATINKGTVLIGSNSLVETVAGSGLSIISGAVVTGAGTLQANSNSELRIKNSTIDTTVKLMSNGDGSLLDVYGNVGAISGTISGGEIEFKGASAANISFASDKAGTLKLDASTTFTGTISGFAGVAQNTFTQFLGFGDSTIDSGAFQYLDTGNPNLNTRIQTALNPPPPASPGTGTPVGVGLMNSQILAADFGLTADTAYAPGGGTNYAIPGAVDAADPGSGNPGDSNYDPGNGSIVNTNPNPQLLSTVDQIESYLSSTGGNADPNALYLISSGGNDVSYALKTWPGDSNAQKNYIQDQADTLSNEIQTLYAAGAKYIIVDNNMANNSPADDLSGDYSSRLFGDLNTSGVPSIASDVNSMLQDVKANGQAFGFTYVDPGTPGTDSNTQSALVEPYSASPISGWGLWGANTLSAEDPSVALNLQYAYLRSADAETTSLYSDDQHLSAAGQEIEANFEYSLLVADKVISQDAIDLADISYVFGTTKAAYSGNTTGGTLSVTDGTETANIALLGNYMASSFVTMSDGGAGTLVVELPNVSQQALLTPPHSPS